MKASRFLSLVGSAIIGLAVATVAFAQTSVEPASQPTSEPVPVRESQTAPVPTSGVGFEGQDGSRMAPPPLQGGSFQGDTRSEFRDGSVQVQVQIGKDDFDRRSEQMMPPPSPNQKFPRGGDFRQMPPPPQTSQIRQSKSFQKGPDNNDGNFSNQRGETNFRSLEQGGEGVTGQNDGRQNSGEDWEAEQAKIDAEQKKREEAMVKRQVAQMSKMLQSTLTTIQKRVAKLKSAGIKLTSDCAEMVTTLTDTLAKAKSATTQEDLYDLQDTMQSMDDVNQCRQIVERLLSVPRILKNAGITIKNLKKRKVDVAEVEQMLSELNTTFGTFKSSSVSNDDVESFFEALDELGSAVAPLMENKNKNSDQGANVFNSSVGFWDKLKASFGF